MMRPAIPSALDDIDDEAPSLALFLLLLIVALVACIVVQIRRPLISTRIKGDVL